MCQGEFSEKEILHMLNKLLHLRVVCLALLLLAGIGVGIYTHVPVAHADAQSITVTENDPLALVCAADLEDGEISLFFPYPFVVKGWIRYTLDMGGPPPMLPPTIKDISQSVDVVGGQEPGLPFSLIVRSSVEVYNAKGQYITTITGQPLGSIQIPQDAIYSLQDSTSIPTQTPYIYGSADNFGKVLFILKQIVFVYADNATLQWLSSGPPYTYYVTAPCNRAVRLLYFLLWRG
jgi:hypothetical protein